MAYKEENLDKVRRAMATLDRAVNTLVKLLSHPDPDVHEPAFLAFVSFGEPAAVDLLFRAAGRTKNPAHRERIVGALGALGIQLQEPVARLLAALSLHERDAGVRAAIARAVTAMGLAKTRVKPTTGKARTSTDKKPDDPP